jgi:Fur family transcriptional regulator, ferric uptake regulator
MRRNTIQRDLVKQAVQDMKKHVTADELYEFLKKCHPSMSKGTVYRNLDILVEEGSVRKVEVPSGPNYYDFTLKNHYHVKCVECGEVTDVDMDAVEGLINKIRDTHGMDFLSYDIVFKGICKNCKQRNKGVCENG